MTRNTLNSSGRNMWVGFRKVEEKYDILRALRHDGLLKEEYIPDVSVEHTAGNLWREMLRFKACISRLDDAFFCLYFPPEQERGIPGQDGSAMC